MVHPSGRFNYSSNRGHDTVTVHRATPSTGALEVIQVQPIRGACPRNINLAPGGSWLPAAGADSNTVAVEALDAETGELTYQTRRVINVPGPSCMVFGNRSSTQLPLPELAGAGPGSRFDFPSGPVFS